MVITLFFGVFGTAASAELQQVWQVDITPYFDSFVPSNPPTAYLCEDGQIIAAARSDPQGCILVINNDGALVDKDIFDGVPGILSGQSPSTYFLVMCSDPITYDYWIRYYEITNNVLSATILTPSILHNILEPKHNEFIELSGMVLTKYKHIPGAPTIYSPAVGIDGANLIVSWDSEPGAIYRIQSSINLTNWLDTGVSLSGTGDVMNWSNSITNPSSFYRVITE